jgi:hypothetical protein
MTRHRSGDFMKTPALVLTRLRFSSPRPCPRRLARIAERLGHPRDAKLLILHADDLGVAHSENAASFDALLKGGVNRRAS